MENSAAAIKVIKNLYNALLLAQVVQKARGLRS